MSKTDRVFAAIVIVALIAAAIATPSKGPTEWKWEPWMAIPAIWVPY